MITNVEILDFSIRKPEPIYAPAYQKEHLVIRKALLDFPHSYFVNTAGFERLVRELANKG